MKHNVVYNDDDNNNDDDKDEDFSHGTVKKKMRKIYLRSFANLIPLYFFFVMRCYIFFLTLHLTGRVKTNKPDNKDTNFTKKTKLP